DRSAEVSHGDRRRPCRVFVLLAVATLTMPVWASQPGHPLDCTDWVFLIPGLSCSSHVLTQASSPSAPPETMRRGANRAVDNSGKFYVALPSGGGGNSGVQIVMGDGETEQVIAYLPGRTYGPGQFDSAYLPASEVIEFDAVSGSLIIPIKSEGGGASS